MWQLPFCLALTLGSMGSKATATIVAHSGTGSELSNDHVALSNQHRYITINVTETLRQMAAENDKIKGRQAVAGVLGGIQLMLFLVYLGTSVVVAIVKCVKKRQSHQLEEQLQEMEVRLSERKAKRRSASTSGKEQAK